MDEAREKAYGEGVDKRIEGEPLEANPYPVGSYLAEDWAEGWNSED